MLNVNANNAAVTARPKGLALLDQMHKACAMKKNPKGISLGILSLDAPRQAAYLKTLSDWGTLDEIVSLTEASRLLGLTCKQNEHALLKIFGDAVWSREMPFWGRSHDEHEPWKLGMLRVLVDPVTKPIVTPFPDGRLKVRGEISHLVREKLHCDAVGIKLHGALELLLLAPRAI